MKIAEKLMALIRPPVASATSRSTDTELEREKRLRAELHRRTDTLAKMLDDYRTQDSILRR